MPIIARVHKAPPPGFGPTRGASEREQAFQTERPVCQTGFLSDLNFYKGHGLIRCSSSSSAWLPSKDKILNNNNKKK